MYQAWSSGINQGMHNMQHPFLSDEPIAWFKGAHCRNHDVAGLSPVTNQLKKSTPDCSWKVLIVATMRLWVQIMLLIN